MKVKEWQAAAPQIKLSWFLSPSCCDSHHSFVFCLSVKKHETKNSEVDFCVWDNVHSSLGLDLRPSPLTNSLKHWILTYNPSCHLKLVRSDMDLEFLFCYTDSDWKPCKLKFTWIKLCIGELCVQNNFILKYSQPILDIYLDILKYMTLIVFCTFFYLNFGYNWANFTRIICKLKARFCLAAQSLKCPLNSLFVCLFVLFYKWNRDLLQIFPCMLINSFCKVVCLHTMTSSN